MSEWLIYQSLWDLQADNLYNQMGEDINTWMTYLNDIQLVFKFFYIEQLLNNYDLLID